MKNTRLYKYVYNFSVDYDAIVDDILDIHKYLLKKHDIWVEQTRLKQRTKSKMII